MEHIDSDLAAAIYLGITEDPPWETFAERLRVTLCAKHVGITLHHATRVGRDVYVMASSPGDTIDWGDIEEIYRTEFMEDDPFRLDRMKPGQVLQVTRAEKDERYQAFLRQIKISQTVRACCAEPGGLQCWIDVARGCEPSEPFSDCDVGVIESLLPHLEQALALYSRINRLEAEKSLYETMIEHMTLGCLLLNREGNVIHLNRAAESMMTEGSAVSIVRNRLQVGTPMVQKELEQAINRVINGVDGAADGSLIRVGDYETRLLGLLVYPAPASYYYQGDQAPHVTVYLSDLSASLDALRPSESHSLDRIRQLLGLTKREATLALLLASGYSIAEASQYMQVAESAVRNYSKNIYAKLGISSQSDLVRIVLRSFSVLK